MQGSGSTESLAGAALDGGRPPGSDSFDAAPLQAYLERLLQLLLGAQDRDLTLLFATSDAYLTLSKFAQDESQKAVYINKLLLEASTDAEGELFLYFVRRPC